MSNLSIMEEREYQTLLAKRYRSNTENVRLAQLQRKRGAGNLSHSSGISLSSSRSDDDSGSSSFGSSSWGSSSSDDSSSSSSWSSSSDSGSSFDGGGSSSDF